MTRGGLHLNGFISLIGWRLCDVARQGTAADDTAACRDAPPRLRPQPFIHRHSDGWMTLVNRLNTALYVLRDGF
jgi:hypothetical protein